MLRKVICNGISILGFSGANCVVGPAVQIRNSARHVPMAVGKIGHGGLESLSCMVRSFAGMGIPTQPIPIGADASALAILTA